MDFFFRVFTFADFYITLQKYKKNLNDFSCTDHNIEAILYLAIDVVTRELSAKLHHANRIPMQLKKKKNSTKSLKLSTLRSLEAAAVSLTPSVASSFSRAAFQEAQPLPCFVTTQKNYFDKGKPKINCHFLPLVSLMDK